MTTDTPTITPTVTPTVTEPDLEPTRRTLEEIVLPYVVILHNDDHNSMEYVVDALVKSVPSLSTEEAISIMVEAHTSGKAIVIACPLEQAEYYRDRIRSFSLGVTIEKA